MTPRWIAAIHARSSRIYPRRPKFFRKVTEVVWVDGWGMGMGPGETRPMRFVIPIQRIEAKRKASPVATGKAA